MSSLDDAKEAILQRVAALAKDTNSSQTLRNLAEAYALAARPETKGINIATASK